MTFAKWILGAALAAALAGGVQAQTYPARQELSRADLTGTDMEIVTSTSEIKPGETLPRHIHHGEEAAYVLEGGTIETPDGKQLPFPAGRAVVNKRDVPHGGFKVVGDKTIKLLTVHIVDKGKPLYDTPPQ